MHDSATCESCRKVTEAKKAFAPGPWCDEPDRVEFEYRGLTCLLRRTPHGHWCGYVAVPPVHPLHGQKSLDDVPVTVHGGITYARPCDGCVCHLPRPGEEENLWWLGFDCAHAGDYSPSLASGDFLTSALSALGFIDDLANDFSEKYRDLAFVRAETERLAEQLARVMPPASAQSPAGQPPIATAKRQYAGRLPSSPG